ncbi:hypothetical protein Bca4012_026505 [Brassica carinata]
MLTGRILLVRRTLRGDAKFLSNNILSMATTWGSKLGAEIKVPVKNTHAYAFSEHGNDLGSCKDVKGNPTAVYMRMGQGSSCGVGVKLGLVRAEYAIDHNNGTGVLFFRFGERYLISCIFTYLSIRFEMVDAITGFVVGKIGDYLIKEASTLMAVKDDLEELKTELTCIHCYLKDVEAREREDEVSKKWTKMVLDIWYHINIACDVEDVLDTYFQKFKERSQRRGLRRLANKISEKNDAYNIGDDIRTLKRRILDITRKRETYGIGRFKEPQGDMTTSSRLVVGLEDDVKFLLAKLFNDGDVGNRYIISIFGMGGRYLVVVDDIWKQDARERLKRALTCNHGGSRIIITTRVKAVAEGVDGRVYVHKLRFLTFEKSWKLFDQKAFMNMQRIVNEDLHRTGKEMVQKCDGLPLAIVVLAGLLSWKRPNEWHEVCASFWRCLKDNSIHISTVFDLSFNELHYELKLFFTLP